MVDVLVVCTANQCRSPMAEALLRAHLDRRGAGGVTVRSAGSYPPGAPASAEALAAMGRRGVDLRSHTSRRVTRADLGSDLVIGMTRSHVREVLALEPAAAGRAFTFRGLVRGAERAGSRRPGEELDGWLRRVAEASGAASEADDIADPMGGPPAGYEVTAAELDRLSERLVAHAFPAG